MITDRLNPAHIASYPTSQMLLGRAAQEWTQNKYAQAAREIAGLELKTPPPTGAPVTGTGFEPGFLDILI